MNLNANVEMPTLAPEATRATAADTSDQSSVSFSDSLLTASKVDSEAGSVTDAGPKATRQPKSTSEDAKASGAASDGHANQSPIVSQLPILQQQALPAQQAQLLIAASPQVELPPAASVAASDAATVVDGQQINDPIARWAAGAGSTTVQSGVVASAGNLSSYSQPSRDLSQSMPISSSSTAKESKALRADSSTTGNSVSDGGVTAPSIADQSMIQNPVLNAAPGEAASSFPQSVLNTASSVTPSAASQDASNAIPNGVQDVRSNATANGILDPALSAATEEAASSSLQSALNAVSSVTSSASSNATSNLVPTATSTAVSNGLQGSFLKAVLKAFAGVIPSGLTTAAPNAAAHVVANAGQYSDLSAVHNAIANTTHVEVTNVTSNAVSNAPLNAGQVSNPHAAQSASPKESAAPETGSVSGSHTTDPLSSDQAIATPGLGSSGATSAQLAAQIQFAAGSVAAGQAGLSGSNSTPMAKISAISSANGKIESSDATDEATGLKQHPLSASNQTTFQAGSQGSTSSADPSQVSASPQGQGTAAAQGSFASHAAVDGAHMQNAAITSPVQTSPAPASATGHAATAPDRAASAAIAAPQAPPVINTAKLIQSAGQSEMRVGMRSNEFGNISISTSATHDSISAQISLDHGELAKTLAAHLPEIQARLGINQSLDVRIDTNGASGGLGAGTSGGFPDSSSGDSRGSRQQAGNAASSYSGNGFSDRQFSPAASVVTTNDGGLNARLDIRI